MRKKYSTKKAARADGLRSTKDMVSAKHGNNFLFIPKRGATPLLVKGEEFWRRDQVDACSIAGEN